MFTNVEEKSTLGERRTCDASFKGLGNNTCAPSSHGGGGHATCRQGHELPQDGAYGLRKTCLAGQTEMEAWDKGHCTWDVENNDRT
jgi:hypothetical protein